VLDLTERKHAEEALRDTQMELAHVMRLTTLGELTASIAHEVNQPLAAVVNAAVACLRWLDRESPDLDEARRAAEWIIKEGNRASEVIRRVRALANRTDIEKVSLDVNDVVREAIAPVQRELTSQRVSWQTELALTPPMILGDRVQLQQVIINLVMNGIEAMQSVTDRPRELVIRSHQDETHRVLVNVTDSGVGISARTPTGCSTPSSPLIQWHGHGTIDLPFDHRSSRGRMSAANNEGTVRRFNSSCPCIKRMRRDRARQIIARTRERQGVDCLRHRRRCSDAHDSQQSFPIGGLASRAVRSAYEFARIKMPDVASCLVLDIRLPASAVWTFRPNWPRPIFASRSSL